MSQERTYSDLSHLIKIENQTDLATQDANWSQLKTEISNSSNLILHCALFPDNPNIDHLFFKPIFVVEKSLRVGKKHFPVAINFLNEPNFELTANNPIECFIEDFGESINSPLLLNDMPLEPKTSTVIAHEDVLSIPLLRGEKLRLRFVNFYLESSFSETNEFLRGPMMVGLDSSWVQEHLKCSLCDNILLESVILEPCKHRFCSYCYSNHHQESPFRPCPNCQIEKLEGIQKDYLSDKMIKKIFSTFPNLRRSNHNFTDSNTHRDYLEKLIIELGTQRVPGSSLSYGSIDSVGPSRFLSSITICRVCAPTKYPGLSYPSKMTCIGLHVACALCDQAIPDTNRDLIQCKLCSYFFCNQLWDCPYVEYGLHLIKEFIPTKFPKDWRSCDVLTEEAFNMYLHDQKITPSYLYSNCIDKFKSGDFLWSKNKLFIEKDILLSDYSCRSCIMNKIFPEFGLYFKNSLDPWLLSELIIGSGLRNNCPKGGDCEENPRDRDHCILFNHWY